MNRVFLLIAAVAAVSGAFAAEPPFSGRITADEAARAGLTKLSTSERKELDALIARIYGTAAKAEPASPGGVAAERKQAEPARVIVAPGTRVELAVLESRIAGEFRGWEPRTTFLLENGELWRVVNDDRYRHPRTLPNPKVRIVPAGLAGFRLEIEGVNHTVRVRRIETTGR